MRNEPGFQSGDGPLSPTVPQDIAARTQRQRILDAMAEVAAEKTYAATTISDVVGHAGVSRATFYKQFENKRECFDAAVELFVETARRTAETAHSSSNSRSEAIRETIAAMLELLAAEPAYAKLAMVEAVSVDPAVTDRHWQRLIGAFETLWDEGERAERAHQARVAFARAQVLIAERMVTGRTEELPELLPDLVYIALLPFAGQEEALKQAQLAR